MLTEPITLEVESDAARFFNGAGQSEKEKLQSLFGSFLIEYAEADDGSLREIVDDIRHNARLRGLTPEILESVLNSE